MENLFELLRRLLLDTDNLQKLLAPLVEKLLQDVPNLNGSKQALLDMLRDGTLDDDFKQDPYKVLICLGYVILDICSFYKVPVVVDGVIAESPVYSGNQATDDYYVNLGVLLGINPLTEGPFTDRLYMELLQRVWERFITYLMQLSTDELWDVLRKFISTLIAL